METTLGEEMLAARICWASWRAVVDNFAGAGLAGRGVWDTCLGLEGCEDGVSETGRVLDGVEKGDGEGETFGAKKSAMERCLGSVVTGLRALVRRGAMTEMFDALSFRV